MRLSERLGRTTPPSPAPSEPAKPRPKRPATIPAKVRSTDPLAELKQRAQATLFDMMGATLNARKLTPAQIQTEINGRLDGIIAAEEHLLSPAERREIVEAVAHNLLGLGPIQPLLDDPDVSEIMVNGPDLVYVERAGHLELTDVSFFSENHIRSIIERIVDRVGRRIDESSPMVDARLADGSRVNAVLPPLALDSPTLTIRKFRDQPLDVDDLVELGTFTRDAAELLETCVAAKCNIVISGGTGSGKTTLLNLLSSFIPEGERVITIEDTAELRLQQRHVVRMETRSANTEGVGEVDMRDLVRNALRMRPDRIVVGECRGAEALDMLQAMNTGHEGSITTLHSNGTRDTLSRMETMVLMAGMDLPLRAVREQITSAIDLIVHVTRVSDGSRRVVEITEIEGMEGEVVQMNSIFTFDWTAGRDDDGRFRGTLRPTGLRPTFSQHLADLGHPLPARLFQGS